MHKILLLISICIAGTSFAQKLTIKGIAPTYLGNSIELYGIQDYFSDKEVLLASSKVESDSTFVFQLDMPITRKVIVKSKNNKGFLYVQPNGQYNIFFPEKDKYDPYRPSGNNVEIAFYDLDSTDINYKILAFQRWIDHFVGNNYYRKDAEPMKFVEALDRFKANVEKAYKDDTSTFFKTTVRFSIAGLDNIQHAAERNRYEKHDFYIKHSPVEYQNDAYMDYIEDFYQNLMPRLHAETNEKVYAGVIRSSPSLIMRALGTEYTLINMRIRELIMVKSLSEVYSSGDYPETNILTILDSVENHSLFESNALIAKNLKERLTDLVPGGKAPNFVLNEKGKDTKTLIGLKGKHVYLHFFDPNSTGNLKELDLIEEMVEKYGKHVQIISIYKDVDSIKPAGLKRIENISWDVYKIDKTNSIWNNYQIDAYPHYVLLDATGYVVSSPALGPTPNGQYETIDRTFFQIKKAWLEANPEEEELYNRN